MRDFFVIVGSFGLLAIALAIAMFTFTVITQ